MPTIASFLAVIVIWSTTPIAITISNQSFTPQFSVLARMSLAFILIAIFIALFRKQSVLQLKNWRIYLMAGVGFFPTMTFIHQSTLYLSSGLVAVLFSLVPIFTGVMATFILKETFFTINKIIAMLLSLSGFLIIFAQNMTFGDDTLKGIACMFCANTLFSVSQVGVKYLSKEKQVDPFEQTLGALVYAVPGFILSWYFIDGNLPTTFLPQSIWATVYLASIGSIFVFSAYFYALKKLSVTVMSLIPLVQPLLTLWLGLVLLDELVTQEILLGTVIIVLALVIFDKNLFNSLLNFLQCNELWRRDKKIKAS